MKSVKIKIARLPHSAGLPLPAYQSAGAAGLLSPWTLSDSIPLWVAAALPTMGSAKATADRNHSANMPGTFGHKVSSDCIRMLNAM